MTDQHETHTIEDEKKSLNVLLWNVWLLPWTPNPSLRAAAMSKFILSLPEPHPDVIVFNEAFSQHDILFSKELKDRYPHNVRLGRMWYTIFSGGVWIYSKYPIVYSNYFHYTGRRGIDWFAAKGMVIARIKVPKENKTTAGGKEEEKETQDFYSIDVYGTHMQGGFEPSMAAARNRHVTEIIDFMGKESKDDALIVFAGDINMGPPSDPHSWHYADQNDANARTGEYLRMREGVGMQELKIIPSPRGIGSFNDINRFLMRGFPTGGTVNYHDFDDIKDTDGKMIPLSDTACLQCTLTLP